MPDLLIRIKKKADGSSALSCERADGSVTWQNVGPRQGAFFPLHDLTHYAVETVLGHRRGFFGLLAEGWRFSDFGAPWPRGPIPGDADPSELIVGFLDAERTTGARWSAEEVNRHAGVFSSQLGIPWSSTLTDDELQRVRARRSELFALWTALPPGETLELPFDRAIPAGSSTPRS